jgi:hypothetical protein
MIKMPKVFFYRSSKSILEKLWKRRIIENA